MTRSERVRPPREGTTCPGACLKFRLHLPFFATFTSDCVLHAYGCDAVLEESCILIQGRSVDQWEGVDLPKIRSWRHGRLIVRAFRAKIEVLSPTSASTSIVVNIDPKTPLPRAVINFLVSWLSSVLDHGRCGV